MLLSVGSSISNFSSNSFVTEPLIDISYLSSTATPYKEALSISATSSLQQRISNSFQFLQNASLSFSTIIYHLNTKLLHKSLTPQSNLIISLYLETMNNSITESEASTMLLHPRTDRPGEPSRPCFVPAIAGGTAGTRRTGIPMETARQLDRPVQQVVSPQPEQGRRPR